MSRKPIAHPVPGELIVATDLAATGKSRTFDDISPPRNVALASPNAPPMLAPMWHPV